MPTTYGWTTDDAAAAYLILKPGTSAWFATGFDPGPYLTEAYRVLFYDPIYLIPDPPSAPELSVLAQAQTELAFSILSSPGTQRRRELVAAGVTTFELSEWSESYGGRSSDTQDGSSYYTSIVANLMSRFLAGTGFIANIRRPLERLL